MSHVTITNAIRTRVASVLNTDHIQYDNQTLQPPDEGLWIRCTIKPANTRQISFGPPTQYRCVGIVIFQIFAEINKGTAEINAKADEVAGYFRSTSYGNVTFKTPTITNVGQRDGDSWYQINVSCPFQSDFHNEE